MITPFEIPVGLLRIALAGAAQTTKRNLANQRKTMLPAIIQAIEADISNLERMTRALESEATENLLIVSNKAEIVNKNK